MSQKLLNTQNPSTFKNKFTKIPCIILLIFFLILSGPSLFTEDSPKYIKMADHITFKTLKNFKNAPKLKLIGSGGSMMKNVEEISLLFYYYHPASIDEARNIILEIANNLISAFNSNQEIQPFLANHPFDDKNLEISIAFMKKNNELQNPPSISSVCISNGILRYRNDDSEKDRLITIYQETYKEALQKITQNDRSYASKAG